MNSSTSPRKINYSHAVIVTGLVLSLLVIMFRPAGAEATKPASVDVFDSWDGDASSVRLDSVGETTRKYDVIFNGKKTSKEVELTGVPLRALLEKVGVKVDETPFVKVRYGTTDDSNISLIPLGSQFDERPPLLLTGGTKPGIGPFATPAIMPGEAGSQAISESEMIAFKTGSKVEPIKIIPAKPGARMLEVRLSRKTTSKREYKYTPIISNGTKGAARKIVWFSSDGKTVKSLGQHDTYTTDDATSGSATHGITAVVTETLSGSTGYASETYNSKSKSKGKTSNPYQPTGSTGGSGGSGGNGGTAGGGTGIPQSGGTSNPLSGFNQPTAPTSQPQQTPDLAQQAQPSAATGQTPTAVDTTAITNAAQNVNGTGGLHTVTGVLLSSPTTAPISDSGGTGTALSALPAPVASQLNSIFQPVDSTDDVWAYLVAILFAFSISGAVREWVNP